MFNVYIVHGFIKGESITQQPFPIAYIRWTGREERWQPEVRVVEQKVYCGKRSLLRVPRDWKAWKMKVVMEKPWNMTNWQKVMEFCDWSSNFTNFAPELYHICAFFADIKKI